MQPSTTDFSSFEHQKENITQLPQGRKASHLSSLYSNTQQSDLARNQDLLTQLAHHKKQSKRANLEDPLEPLFTFITWMTENFPQGHPEIMLTVEKAARDYRKDDR